MDKFEQVARAILKGEKRELGRQRPPGVGISLEWKKNYYVGSIQQIELKYDPEIVLLSKSSKSIPYELHQAILRLDSERIQLTADGILDLEGRLHILRRVGNNLTNMTTKQMDYMQTKNLALLDQTGQITIHSQSHYYGKISKD